MPGFSDKALNAHFKLYQGYVTNTNLLIDILDRLTAEGKNRSPEYAEIKRRFGWEFDGMRLHEYYFENLGGKEALDSETPLYARLATDFGSYDNWKADFIATGAMRGIGWAVLYRDSQNGKLFNTWINEHDLGHLAGGKPLLIMDVFEHAYMIDYLLDRAQYIDAFFKNINWEIVSKRFNTP
ncbi:MAG: superoxide dismutase [Thermodesulfobacteriota bacterium]